MNRERTVYIVGHRNPDTDSICSAIALAYLKDRLQEKKQSSDSLSSASYVDSIPANMVHKAVRTGHINTETRYVLDTFGVPAPSYMGNAKTQLKDIDYSRAQTVSDNISLKQAWKMMRAVSKSTLAVTDEEGHLKGLITMSDIAKSYMAALDTHILSVAKTPYENILDTLNGTLVVGDRSDRLSSGKVMIAAANTELMRQMTEPNDVVILGNRYEAQLGAIEAGASIIIVCDGAVVSRTIKKIAEANNCAVISTPFDTYAAARLINQSMPIDYFMTKNPIAFREDDYVDDIRQIMTRERFRDFPITTQDGVHVGMISRRNLIDMDKKRFILVDHNEADQAIPGIEQADVVEIIDHHKLGTIQTLKPVNIRNMPVGCTATIIYQLFVENNIEIPKAIAGLLCSAIISDTLLFKSPTCTMIDKMVAEKLAQIAGVDPEKHAMAMFDAGSDLKDKSVDAIFYQDFKKFKAGGKTFGVGQVNTLNINEMEDLKNQMKSFLEHAMEKEDTDMLFFLFTDILNERSCVLFTGKGAKDLLIQGFGKYFGGDEVVLDGVVSRKKQFVPTMMEQIQA